MGWVQTWGDMVLRGPEAGGGYYYLCEFENFDEFAMGDDTFNGGTFSGKLTNHGTFNYWHGDFSTSELINYGYFNHHAPFTCRRLISHSDLAITPGHEITATTSSYTYAIENYATMTIHPNAPLTITGGKPLLNEGEIYAGALLGRPRQSPVTSSTKDCWRSPTTRRAPEISASTVITHPRTTRRCVSASAVRHGRMSMTASPSKTTPRCQVISTSS